jgi:N-acetylneuraminate synthase
MNAVPFRIGAREISPSQPVYIVAELSGNHGQNFDQAVRMVHAARAAGADAIKLQTYTPDTMTLNSQREWFRISSGTPWDGRTLYDLYGEAHTPWDWQPKLKDVASGLGMDLFSTAFDSTSVEFLEEMGVPVHKIASFDIVDIPLIRRVARTGKPLILSTGMAALAEIEEAVSVARQGGAAQIALLKCTSAYPAPPEEMNLHTISHLSQAFGVPVGLSDHTLGTAVPVAAVALGACLVEKHFTLSRAAGGPDAVFSLEPHEFRQMVDAIRVAEKALGSVTYGLTDRETKSRVFRRSLFAVSDISSGETLTEANVRSIRPALGLHPRYLPEVLGKVAACDIECGTPLTWAHIG